MTQLQINPNWSSGLIWIISICYFLRFGHVICTSQYKLYGVSITIRDHVCTGDDVIENLNTGSAVVCAVNCVMTETCLGFFYHGVDQACVMCNKEWYDGVTGLGEYPGMVFFRQRQGKSCAELVSLGLTESMTSAEIDPDGTGTEFGPVVVSCDLDSEPGKSITVLHHSGESRTLVSGYESCVSYVLVLDYNVGFQAAVRIADDATGCLQYVAWECQRTTFSRRPSYANSFCTAWYNRRTAKTNYFTVPNSSNSYCECGHLGTCDSDSDCNCDNEDGQWRFDGGNITVKNDLPIYAFMAGDTGEADENGYHTIGPLYCW